MPRRIGDWIADDQTDELSRGDVRRKLERRAMAVLMYLADHVGQVVSKDALIERVWGQVAISDHSVAIVISQIRRALGDDSGAPAYIQTIPKRGYKLIADVQPAEEAPSTEPEPKRQDGPGASGVDRRTLAIALVGIVAFVVASAALSSRREPRPTIAVADFVNATGSADQNHIAYALTELVSSRLVEHSAGQILRWRGDLPRSQAGRLLGRNQGDVLLLSGRIFPDQGSNVISTQIQNLRTGEVLRGGLFPVSDDNLVASASEIARDLASTLGRPLPANTETAAFPADAYALYWRARHAASLRGDEAPRQARDILVTLVRTYPTFAPGHAALADIYAHKTGEHLGLPRTDTFAEAARHLAEARRLGGETSETAVTEATLTFYRDHDSTLALRQTRRAIELAPENALAWQTLAMVLSTSARDDEAIDAISRAQAIDPTSPSILWDRVWFLYVAGRYRDALSAAQEAQIVAPPNQFYLALIYQALGRATDARRAWLARALGRGLDPTLAATAARADVQRASAALLAAMRRDRNYRDQGVPLAILLLNAGDRAGALMALEEAGSPRDSWLVLWAARLPALSTIRDDPRVRALTARHSEARSAT